MNSQSGNRRSDGREGRWTGVGIAIGAGWGVALGLVLGNLALGIAIGAALGSAIGAFLAKQQQHYRLAHAISGQGRTWFLAVGGLLLFSVAAGVAVLLLVVVG
jgi:hypothetical protein